MTLHPVEPATKVAVDTILGLAQLPVIEDEYERLLRWYPLLREQAAALRIPEVRYGAPAMIYPALEHKALP
jgi:hypothetical protein